MFPLRIALVLIFGVFLTSCSSSLWNAREDIAKIPQNTQDHTDTKSGASVDSTTDANTVAALNSGTVESVPERKNALSPLLSVTSKDQDDCSKNFSGSLQESCLTNFFLRKALQDHDPSICENIVYSWSMSQCKNTVLTMDAVLKKDASLCNSLDNSEFKGNCFAEIGIALSGSKANDEACAHISDPETQKYCTDFLANSQTALK